MTRRPSFSQNSLGRVARQQGLLASIDLSFWLAFKPLLVRGQVLVGSRTPAVGCFRCSRTAVAALPDFPRCLIAQLFGLFRHAAATLKKTAYKCGRRQLVPDGISTGKSPMAAASKERKFNAGVNAESPSDRRIDSNSASHTGSVAVFLRAAMSAEGDCYRRISRLCMERAWEATDASAAAVCWLEIAQDYLGARGTGRSNRRRETRGRLEIRNAAISQPLIFEGGGSSFTMAKSDRFRAEAERCDRLAKSAVPGSLTRDHFRRLADQRRTMAADADKLEAVREPANSPKSTEKPKP